MYAAEFVWPSKDKPSMCPSLKPVQKNRQNELKFTFDVFKCDRIFDELLKHENIRLSHAIPSPDELKRHAYCKWHILSHMLLMSVMFSVDRSNRL